MGLSRYLLRKVAKRMYCINYLFRAGLPTTDIVCVYTSIIRSVLEYYWIPVWHPGLTKKLPKDIECVHKRCLKLMFPVLSYTESLRKSGLERSDDRRDMITQSLFRQIKDPKHPLHLLPPVKVSHSQMVLQPTYPLPNSTGQNFTLWKGLWIHSLALPRSYSSAA